LLDQELLGDICDGIEESAKNAEQITDQLVAASLQAMPTESICVNGQTKAQQTNGFYGGNVRIMEKSNNKLFLCCFLNTTIYLYIIAGCPGFLINNYSIERT
jgi:hypothetical protein